MMPCGEGNAVNRISEEARLERFLEILRKPFL